MGWENSKVSHKNYIIINLRFNQGKVPRLVKNLTKEIMPLFAAIPLKNFVNIINLSWV